MPVGVRLVVTLGLGALLMSAGCDRKSRETPTSAASTPTPVTPSASAPTAAPSADTVSAASEPMPEMDAGPSVIGTTKVDGAALRKRHVARLKSDLSPVTVLTGASALELGQALCEAVMPARRWDTPILLKPNLCGFDSIRDPEKSKGDDGVVGRTTSVDFTRGVVRCLKKRGHRKITIAEGCGISHAHFKRVIALTGYEAMAKEEQVPLVAMDDDGVYDVEGDQPGLPLAISGIAASRVPTLLMPKVLAEHLDKGLFVSLPKIKAHRFSVTSMAIKGMQGTVMRSDARPAYKQKYRMHAELGHQLKERRAARAAAKARDAGPAEPVDPIARRKAYVASLRAFGERMVDVLELETPDVVLADGAPAMGGDGFSLLYPSDELVAVGGTNPVLVDRVGAELLGVWNNARLASELLGHKTSPLIELAAKRFGLDLSKTRVVGNGASLLSKPRPVHYRSMDGFAIHSDATPPWQPLAPNHAPSGSVAPPSDAGTPAPTPHSAPPDASPARAEAHAAALGKDRVVIDGKADDAVWSRAPAVEWNTDWSGATTSTRTTARFAWSDEALFALFELHDTGLFVDRSRPVTQEREKLYQEDCVELFLGHDANDPRHYLEIELGPFGHYFDLDVRLGGKFDASWSSGAKVGTTQDAKARRAVIEARLAAPAIVSALQAAARLPLGLYRMEGKAPRKYLAWSPTRTAKPNFHVPSAFGVLVLDAAENPH